MQQVGKEWHDRRWGKGAWGLWFVTLASLPLFTCVVIMLYALFLHTLKDWEEAIFPVAVSFAIAIAATFFLFRAFISILRHRKFLLNAKLGDKTLEIRPYFGKRRRFPLSYIDKIERCETMKEWGYSDITQNHHANYIIHFYNMGAFIVPGIVAGSDQFIEELERAMQVDQNS